MKDGVHMGIFNFLFETLKKDMKETYVLHDLLKPEETNEKPLLRDIQDFTYKKKKNAQVLKITRGQWMLRGFTPYDFWLLKWCVFPLSSSSCTFKFSFASFFISSLPISMFQGSTIARQMGAVAYVECTSKVSENSVRDVFHITTLASVRRPHKPQLKRSSSRRGLKRVSQLPLPPLPGRTEQIDQAPAMRKDRAKSCVLM